MIFISVRQPWASLLVSNSKTIETRTWATKRTGLVGIHAGLKIDHYGPLHRFPNASLLPIGAVIGTVELIECRPMRPADSEAALCEYREGLFAWITTNGNFFDKPIPMKGRLGFWKADLH